MKKRFFAAMMSLCLLFTLFPAAAFAQGEPDSGTLPAQGALCEHHPSHDAACGYTEGTAETPCTHEHDEDCYTLVTNCVHEHTAECYPPEQEEAEPAACTHVGTEESGCITKVLDCKHTHDAACGYTPAAQGTPCTFVCEICNSQDSGEAEETEPEAQCLCTQLCTEDNINADCPVCSAEGADFAACLGEAPAACTCENLCAEGSVNPDCPVCGAEGADLAACLGTAPAMLAPAMPLANGTTVYVGGVKLYGSTDSPAYATTKGGTVIAGGDEGNYSIKWDGETLTLRNTIITEGYYFSGNSRANIYRDGPLTINLVGNSTVNLSVYDLTSYGIYTTGDLTIQGSGSLAAISSMVYGSYGIFTLGTITIQGGAVTAECGGDAVSGSEVIIDPLPGHSITVTVRSESAIPGGEKETTTRYDETTTITDSTRNASYFHSETTRGANIQIGGEELYGSTAETAYAKTDESGNVTKSDETAYSISWDGETLTLKGAVITNDSDDGNGILYEEEGSPIKIMLQGTNSVTGSEDGIRVSSSNLTISGNGSLTATGNRGDGIDVFLGDLTINSGTVSATGISSNNISINSGTVSANDISASSSISIKGGMVTVTDSFFGISATDVSIENGTVIVDNIGNTGIRSYGDVTITGGKVTITGGYYGISGTPQNITISGGEVTITGNTEAIQANTTTIAPKQDTAIAVEVGDSADNAEAIDGSPFMAEETINIGSTPNYFHSAAYAAIPITTQPSDATVTEGETAAFTVTATGSNLTYQWQQSTGGSTWTDISGATAATYIIPATTAAMSGTQYRCVLTQSENGSITGMAISNAATLTVNAKTVITSPPSDATVIEGQTATFTVTATGTEPLSYQWQQNMNDSGWTDINSATNSSYTTAAATMNMDGYQYRCVVKGSGGEVTSGTATLTVNPVQYTVTVQTDGNGTASASPASAPAGTAVTLTADPESGYRFKGWEVVSGNITIENNAFIMPAGNVTVKAVFDRNSSGFVPTRPWKPSRPVEPEEPEEPETPVLNGWVQEDGVWYLYQSGSLTTGWNLHNGSWYYLDGNGKMLTGWQRLNGTWYYLHDWGGMVTGWQNLNGTWYYLHDWGGMATGWINLGGTWYYLYDWGGMATGWQLINGAWYYLKDWGGMATGWQLINGRWYYFYPGGSMAANTYVNGYYLSGSGAWAE